MDPSRELLERADQLSALAECVDAVQSSSRGRLVLIGGEAGVGKTSLPSALRRRSPSRTRMLWGACDALLAPRPLGSFLDIAESTGGELQELVEADAAAFDVATALMRELRARPATILVLEDVHWADDATLDVLRLLGRRVESLPAALHERTGGNPFFVTEVLAAGEEIPETVRDAVLARSARLKAEARALLDAVAIAPSHSEVSP